MLFAIILLQYMLTVNMSRSAYFCSYSDDAGPLSSRNGVLGTGMLDSRPCTFVAIVK